MVSWLLVISVILLNVNLNINPVVESEEVKLVELPEIFETQSELVDRELGLVIEIEEEVEVYNERDILFSNYYQTDGSSGSTTASGLTTRDFKVNTMGMYTYHGKVVLATANTTRLLYDMPSGFESNELYDEMVIVFRGIEYDAIVLDVCGMCTWGNQREELQRVDIFTTHKIMGVEEGKVREKDE